MAVCIVMEFAGMDVRQYEALMDVLELRGVNPAWPKGIISHVVGFTNHGAYVVDVWQSLQIFDAFLENRLRPAFEVVGGLPEPRVITFDVYKSYVA